MTPQPHGKRLDSVNTRETHNHICSRDMGFLVYAVCENKARIEDNWTNLVLCTESVESPAPGVRMARVLPQNLSHLSFKIERVESARPIQSTCHELNFLHLGSLHKTFFIARWFWYIGQWCVGRFSGCNFHLPPSFDVITDSLKQLLHRISYCRIWTEPFTTFCSRGKSCRWKFPIYMHSILFSLSWNKLDLYGSLISLNVLLWMASCGHLSIFHVAENWISVKQICFDCT